MQIAVLTSRRSVPGISKTDHQALDLWFGSGQIMMHSLTAHMVKEIVGHAEQEKDRFKRILDAKMEG